MHAQMLSAGGGRGADPSCSATVRPSNVNSNRNVNSWLHVGSHHAGDGPGVYAQSGSQFCAEDRYAAFAVANQSVAEFDAEESDEPRAAANAKLRAENKRNARVSNAASSAGQRRTPIGAVKSGKYERGQPRHL
jgi:GH25 family lysozyme M1 (1,4-beta-N-acetylmuramidase)